MIIVAHIPAIYIKPMDFALLRTFVVVAETGSFAAASERLFVTQSAVSLRVQRLEENLGRALFVRSKTGADLTLAGHDFQVHAVTLLKGWEEARQHLASPGGEQPSVTIGAEPSIWQHLGLRWLKALRTALPKLVIRAESGTPETLSRSIAEGTMQLALSSAPTLRSGHIVRQALEDDLVMAAPWKEATRDDVARRYAYVNWGEAFHQFHNQSLPELATPQMTLDPNAFSELPIRELGLAAFLPESHLSDAGLFPVHGVPRHARVIWSEMREDLDPQVGDVAEKLLSEVAHRISCSAQDEKD